MNTSKNFKYVPNVQLLFFVRNMKNLKKDYTNPEILLKNKRLTEILEGSKSKKVKSEVSNCHESEAKVQVKLPERKEKLNRKISTQGECKGKELEEVIGKLKRGVSNLIQDEDPRKLEEKQMLVIEEEEGGNLAMEEVELFERIRKLNEETDTIVEMKEDSEIVNVHKWKYLETLGEGSYGKVYLVVNLGTNELRAFKRIVISNRKLNTYLLREIHSLLLLTTSAHFTSPTSQPSLSSISSNFSSNSSESSQNSENSNTFPCNSRESSQDSTENPPPRSEFEEKRKSLLKVEKIYWGVNRVYMSFPVMNYNLREYLCKYFRFGMDLKLIKKIVKKVLSSLHVCHSNEMIHRDIKPDNILLLTTFSYSSLSYVEGRRAVKKIPFVDRVVLSDFGLSRQLNTSNKKMTMEVVTLNYRAPELLLGYNFYSYSIDIWSIGLIIIELLTGRQLFNEKNEFGLLISIFKFFGKPSEEEWSQVSSLPYLNIELKVTNKFELFESITQDEKLIDLLTRMLDINPNKRITAGEAMGHEFFT